MATVAQLQEHVSTGGDGIAALYEILRTLVGDRVRLDAEGSKGVTFRSREVEIVCRFQGATPEIVARGLNETGGISYADAVPALSGELLGEFARRASARIVERAAAQIGHPWHEQAQAIVHALERSLLWGQKPSFFHQ